MLRLPLALLAIAVATLALAACGGAPPPPLRPPAPAAPVVVVDRDGVQHEGIAVAAGEAFEWAVPAAAAERLRLAWAAPSATGTVRLVVEDAAGERLAVSRSLAPCEGGCDVFHEDLPAPTAGGTLRVFAEPASDLVLSDLRLVTPHRRHDALILVVLDTTRRDALGLYGSRRPTTPHLDRIFADAWRAERAYALASWTVPSVASLLTGSAPEAFEDDRGAPLGIPAGTTTLADDLRRAGWSTAHFEANAALRRENGFAAGFTTFYTPPRAAESMRLPGDETMRRVAPWVAAHAGEPFFLYLQLIEPHEPWGRPDRARGETSFDPDYDGPFDGHESHYALTFGPRPTPRDVEHLRALYDDDVRYADQLLGAFWEGLGESLRRRATLVFTSDHGEEFLEHGGWRHGPSLYDEVLRVPLLVRGGDGARPLAAPPETLVSLADLRPTLLDLFDLEPAATSPAAGRSLLDRATWERESLPAIHMLTGGGARAVVVGRDGKLTFYDRFAERGVPDPSADPRGHRLALHLRDLLPSLGWFDLPRDPAEERLLPPTGDRRRRWRAIEQSLAHTRDGLELRLLGSDRAATVRLGVALAGADSASAERFALEPRDELTPLTGGWQLRLALPPGDVDGVLFPDSGDAAASLGVTVEAGCVRMGGSRLPRGVPTAVDVSPGIPRLTTAADCATLFAWRAAGRAPTSSPEERDERRRELRALGYIH